MQNNRLIDISDKHFYITSSSDIDNIVAPLKTFKIHMFSFLRNYEDGSQIYLSNNAQWIKDYYGHCLFQSSLFESRPNQYQTGFIAWPMETNSDVFLHGKNYFNSHYGVTYCEKHFDFCEFYFFSGSDVPYLQNLLLNNKDIIHHFILYFKDRARDLMKKANRYKILIPWERNPSVCSSEKNEILINRLPNVEQLKADFFSKSKVHNYYFQDNDKEKKIPPRQLEFVIQLLNHKNIPEIADILNISTRTAESYLNDIKLKFNCDSKNELIDKWGR